MTHAERQHPVESLADVAPILGIVRRRFYADHFGDVVAPSGKVVSHPDAEGMDCRIDFGPATFGQPREDSILYVVQTDPHTGESLFRSTPPGPVPAAPFRDNTHTAWGETVADAAATALHILIRGFLKPPFPPCCGLVQSDRDYVMPVLRLNEAGPVDVTCRLCKQVVGKAY